MHPDELEPPELEDEPGPQDGPLWCRTAEVLGVSFPERTIELVVIPYETPARVEWGGRSVWETIARGAFDGIQRRANRVRVNVDHSRTVAGTVGRAVAFHPDDKRGLVAQVRIAKTQLGDDTLTLADDGDLGASAGFSPMTGGMQWERRNAYRITRAFLGHIAMTPDPAYEDARVLAVRKRVDPAVALSRTPNLDEWKAILREDRVTSGLSTLIR